jgi:hypothetical protein
MHMTLTGHRSCSWKYAWLVAVIFCIDNACIIYTKNICNKPSSSVSIGDIIKIELYSVPHLFLGLSLLSNFLVQLGITVFTLFDNRLQMVCLVSQCYTFLFTSKKFGVRVIYRKIRYFYFHIHTVYLDIIIVFYSPTYTQVIVLKAILQ